MKKLILLFICLSFVAKAQVYSSLNINLLAHMTPETDNTNNDGRKYSGCWGWFQSAKNKEYAIVGTSKQTLFIDVTNPSSPVIVDSVRAKTTGCTWREIKTYQHYCYIVSDDGPPNAFQIVDMQYLPDSVHVVHNGTTFFERSHTIFIDQDKMYCGAPKDVGTGYQSPMRVYSLTNPEIPVLLRRLEDDISSSLIDYVHDMFVRNDTIYASTGWKGLQILKFNSSNNTFSLLQSFANYPYSGYNHSSWQTDDRKTIVFADEVSANLPAKVIDVSDFNNITLVDTIRSSYTATAHNPYIIGNRWCWISSYRDGLYLYDISSPANTSVYGYFDTQPQTGTDNYSGNWGAYPFLPSRIIIACDMQNGIFILEGDNTYKSSVGVKENTLPSIKSVFSVFPNPANQSVNCLIANQNGKNVELSITNALGQVVAEETWAVSQLLFKTSVNTSTLEEGCYFVTIKGNNLKETKKIIIQK